MKTTRKIMFNEDNTHQFCEYGEAHVRLTPKIAEEYISQYVGTQVTDYLINVNSMTSSYPSDIIESYDQAFLKKRENGRDVDYSNTNVRGYYESFIEDKYDMYAHWITLLREINIRPWVSFRMNDCHGTDTPTSSMVSDFYHEQIELHRVHHHVKTGYYDDCFDYSSKIIRDRMLAYIDATLDRYDIDGIELDFMRELFCFQIGGEYNGIEIMTNFIRDVKKIISKYEDMRNKKLPLLVRVGRSPEDCLYMGFDVVNWAKEGLVNIIVASPRWCPTDNDIPVEFWKRILAPYDVEFAAAAELILTMNEQGFCLNTHETTMATCAQHLSAGANFAYLFNYMRSNVTNYNDPENYVMFSDLYKWDNYQHLLRNAGELETAMKCVRRHVPTHQDLVPEWKSQYRVFPANCEKNDYFIKVRIRTGLIPKNAKVFLILGCTPKDDENAPIPYDGFEIYVNSSPVTCNDVEVVRPILTKKPGYIFPIENTSILAQVNMIEVAPSKNGKPFIIDFAEIRIIPQ